MTWLEMRPEGRRCRCPPPRQGIHPPNPQRSTLISRAIKSRTSSTSPSPQMTSTSHSTPHSTPPRPRRLPNPSSESAYSRHSSTPNNNNLSTTRTTPRSNQTSSTTSSTRRSARRSTASPRPARSASPTSQTSTSRPVAAATPSTRTASKPTLTSRSGTDSPTSSVPRIAAVNPINHYLTIQANRIYQNLIRELASDFNKYLQFQLEELLIDPVMKKQFNCCPHPGCGYIFKSSPQQSKFICQMCKHSFCLRCRCNWHDQWTCVEYQKLKDPNFREEAFNQFLAQQNGKKCAKCDFWVIKSEGCNHMTCRCGYEFCYKCGRIYKDPNCKCPLFDRTN